MPPAYDPSGVITHEARSWPPNPDSMRVEYRTDSSDPSDEAVTTLLPETGWIHPAPAPPLRLPDSSSGEAYGKASASLSGSGVDFFGIREWRPGDARSAIHWRASARRNQLVVMERERPGYPTLVVVVGPLADSEAQESLLSRVAATALRALRDGRGVVLLADGEPTKVTRPVDALDWFAAVDPSALPTGEQLRSAMQLAGTGAIVVWLGKGPLPTQVAAAGRGVSAGTVVAAADLAGQGAR